VAALPAVVPREAGSEEKPSENVVMRMRSELRETRATAGVAAWTQ